MAATATIERGGRRRDAAPPGARPPGRRGPSAAEPVAHRPDRAPLSETAGADGGALTERAAAVLTSRLLRPDETIVLLLKPSPLYILLAPRGTVVAGDFIGLGSSQQRGLAGLGVSLILLRLAWQFLEWLSRVYVLTDKRVIRQQGVLRVSVFECPLMKVQHTDLALSLRERLTGLGTIAFSTAGSGGIEAVWHMIARPMDVHQTVIEAVRRYGR